MKKLKKLSYLILLTIVCCVTSVSSISASSTTPTPVFGKKMTGGLGNVTIYIDNSAPAATY